MHATMATEVTDEKWMYCIIKEGEAGGDNTVNNGVNR